MKPGRNAALIGLAALAALFFALAGPAAAEESPPRVFKGSFGHGELSLTEQSGVAVEQESGHVYVADTGGNRIMEYDAAGGSPVELAALSEPTFLAVDDSTAGPGDVYVVSNGRERITKLDSSGAPVTGWGTGGSMEGLGKIDGIAVDGSGSLFVLTGSSAPELYELAPGGAQSNECTVPYASEGYPAAANGIAVDTEGHLYFLRKIVIVPGVLEFLEGAVRITTACGATPHGRELFRGRGQEFASVAVAESDNSVFLSRSAEVQHFASDGEELIGYFGPGEEALEHASQLAVGNVSEAVYVADPGKQWVAIFEPEAVEPPEIHFEEPGAITELTGSSAHFKAEINPKGYGTIYSLHCIPNCSGPGMNGSRELPAGTAFETVEATAEGLAPGTEYLVYVEAKNAGGKTRAPEEGGLPFTTDALAPQIEAEFVSEASETEAALTATLNPGGTEAHYRAQYVTEAQYEASEFAEAGKGPEQSASGGEGIQVSASVAGLSPGTRYVARIIATNKKGAAEGEALEFSTQEPTVAPGGSCANEAFRAGPSANLPDCRAYEQSTPTDKNGGGVEAVPGAVQANEAPDSITFYSQAGIPGGVGAQDYPTFISSRGEGSWSTQGLLPPQSLGPKAVYLGLTPGGRYAISEASQSPEGAGSQTGLFRRDLQSGEVRTIVPYRAEVGTGFFFDGASEDGSRIFFESIAPLTGETPAGQRNVFVWEEATGEVTLLSLNEAGEPLPEGGFAGPYDWMDENPALGGSKRMYVAAAHAISADGSQIVFTEAEEAGEGSAEESKTQLYVRRGIGSGSPESVKLSAYQGSASGPEERAAFLEATPDGRYVFFKSKAALTEDAYAGEAGHESESLYRYDTSTDTLTDLTPDPAEAQADGPEVQGMLGASESGQVAYFVANAALTGEAGPSGETAQAGEPNLYRWEEGGSLSFVATLRGGILYQGSGDTLDWSPAIEDPGTTGAVSSARRARVSADGASVLFSSRRALTEAPNKAANCFGAGNACAEFFRYAAAPKTLGCVSCNPTGASPLGEATIGTAFVEAQDLPVAYGAPVLPRNLSADGDRFFFQTPDALVAADVNGRSGCPFTDPVNPSSEHLSCLDVYEWEAPGAGSCPEAAATKPNGGCVYLISSGQSERPSFFADADRKGDNAYIFTTSQLVPADKDQLFDVYDARVEGGLESQQSSHTLPPSCESPQACQGAQPGPETAIAPGWTSTFAGPGNPKTKVNRSCSRPARQAGSLSRRAKKLRRSARRVAHHNAAKAKQMRRKAKRLSARARRKSRQVRSCRRGGKAKSAKRHTSHNRRAAR